MDEYYEMANVVLRIHHEEDGLFSYIDDEIRRYKTKKLSEVHCNLYLKPKIRDFLIPKKAVRSSFFDGQTVYSNGEVIMIAGEDSSYLIRMGIGKKEIFVDYDKESPMLRKVTRWLLKWLIIRSAEEQGLIFLHASAAHYQGKNVIFCGDSHCGKSSSLFRLVENGATVISDDSVISDGSRLFPFTFKTTVDEDFAKRFNLDNDLFDIGKHSKKGSIYKDVDYVFFLKIWNNNASEIRPLEYSKALLNLIRIYKKEIPFLWSNLDNSGTEVTELIFKKYSSLLENAKCFEFYAGFDEAEVRRSLISTFGVD